jgi:hypothetical protein
MVKLKGGLNMKNKTNEKGTVTVEVDLPEKWVKMISALQEWEDEPIDLGVFVRDAVRVSLRADIEFMDTSPVGDEA